MSIVCELTSMTVKTSGSTKDLSQWYSMSTASNARTPLAIYSLFILASITAILTSTCESVSGKCMISESGQTLQRCATTDMDAPHRDIKTVSSELLHGRILCNANGVPSEHNAQHLSAELRHPPSIIRSLSLRSC
jgi:hypothetical protein